MTTSYGPQGFAGISDQGYQQRVIICGTGSPEGVIPGDPGTIYHDSAAGAFWHKTTGFGQTGWTQATVFGAVTLGAVTGTTAAFSGAVSGTTGTFSSAVAGTSVTGTSQVTTSSHGATYNVLSTEATVTCSGATSTATNFIPTGATLVGFSARVTTLITSGDGATSFTIGDGSTADLYATGVAFTAGTTTTRADYKTPLTQLAPGLRNIVLTATGGAFSGGVVRLAGFYVTTTAPTS